MSKSPEEQLQEKIQEFVDDPFGFVMYAYPWGEKGTFLEHETGPDPWQERVLKDIGHALKYGEVENNGVTVKIVNGRIWISVRSGHGVGKSALMAMLDHWFISTHPDPASVTTANTETQLRTKTWRENGKWAKLLINSHWFIWSSMRLQCKASEHWYSQAIPWSHQNTQGFAGTHEKYLMMKFDEASEIDDEIWEVSEGAMTEPHGLKIWIVFGNPTQATGRFSECFKKFRSMWITYEVDARDSNRTDHEFIKRQIELYGEDSDFIRVRVKGQEPRAGTSQFIGNDIAEAAKGRHISNDRFHSHPKIMGVDIARKGDDSTVFIKRQGLAAYDMQKFRNKSGPDIAGLIAQEIKGWKPDAVFLDMAYIGSDVYDILTRWKYNVTGIWFNSDATDQDVYRNKRAEMWGRMKDWLINGGCIPDDNQLRDDLIGPEYQFTLKEQFQLEAKADMKARGLASPDCFVSGTLVRTQKGERSIEEIEVGDMVRTPFGLSPVIAKHESMASSLTAVRFSNGKSLTGKGKHKIFSFSCGLLRLDALTFTNDVEPYGYWRLVLWRLVSLSFIGVKDFGFKQAVGTINQVGRVRRRDFFIAGFGRTTTAISQRVSAFITRMVIGAITTSQTLRLGQQEIMPGCTRLSPCKTRSIKTNAVGGLIPLEKKRQSGIAPRLGSSGTQNMARIHGLEEKASSQSAVFAAKNMNRSSQAEVGSVQNRVLKKRDTSVISQTFASALIVAKSLWQTAIGRQRVVPVSVQTESVRPTPTYNLTLKKHNAYYANGILVFNCADALALTFAHDIPHKSSHTSLQDSRRVEPEDYNPLDGLPKVISGAPPMNYLELMRQMERGA